mmetsp:Transcript_5200/g.13049  ORF Transcript_5200/g.13049 Transcript_5200/m.13049 type:complete len:294 (-) Transcript_5200:966-1847(-)
MGLKAISAFWAASRCASAISSVEVPSDLKSRRSRARPMLASTCCVCTSPVCLSKPMVAAMPSRARGCLCRKSTSSPRASASAASTDSSSEGGASSMTTSSLVFSSLAWARSSSRARSRAVNSVVEVNTRASVGSAVSSGASSLTRAANAAAPASPVGFSDFNRLARSKAARNSASSSSSPRPLTYFCDDACSVTGASGMARAAWAVDLGASTVSPRPFPRLACALRCAAAQFALRRRSSPSSSCTFRDRDPRSPSTSSRPSRIEPVDGSAFRDAFRAFFSFFLNSFRASSLVR